MGEKISRTSAQIEQNVSDCTAVQLGTIPERHLRPLTGLTPEKQHEAWKEAVDTATDGRLSVTRTGGNA